ncbi:50S ribosomal protein 6 protein [Thalictrum thalictroides]|uniref:50S ribosomal protein 6 protein n=1 Tax=Thalictrum thalictroides TaxID=46969 RepID=A0A7J6X205_THATH|nr:50S ribosomal protein 6 protein [Thalictrum thalictroides]
MSISALFGTRVMLIPKPSLNSSSSCIAPLPKCGGAAVIECSSRPQKKATAHHRKTRPKKTQPWDVKRRPTVYEPLPPLPSEWSLLTNESTSQELEAQPLVEVET